MSDLLHNTPQFMQNIRLPRLDSSGKQIDIAAHADTVANGSCNRGFIQCNAGTDDQFIGGI